MTPCELIAEVSDENDSRCKDASTIATKLRDIIVMLEADHSYSHMKAVQHLSAGAHPVSDAKVIKYEANSMEALMAAVCAKKPMQSCKNVVRYGNVLMVKASTWIAYDQYSDIDWNDCSEDLPFSPPFLAAVKYGALALLATRDKKQTAALFANATFQQLLGVAQRADEAGEPGGGAIKLGKVRRAYAP